MGAGDRIRHTTKAPLLDRRTLSSRPPQRKGPSPRLMR
ncbi:hypothetical protein C791_0106 [Amycolatopsis azurea DSM 43854]|uniref:Uncharacterized protein n=1 Tax=Amycolatopsis azurea DSM 43854 TaxID=1238180 RepID=M2QUD5_9PSEU|nr:hypothetical protein C791_0106 [Amycolatopsis azurea DSM 43854]